jgi:hypothetical protein
MKVTQIESPTRKAGMHRVACTSLVLEKNEFHYSDYRLNSLCDFAICVVYVRKYWVGDKIDLKALMDLHF